MPSTKEINGIDSSRQGFLKSGVSAGGSSVLS
jgi:hypothetical protein